MKEETDHLKNNLEEYKKRETSLLAHKGEYICKTCAKSFKTKAALNDHNLSKLETTESMYHCKKCDALFSEGIWTGTTQ